VVDWLGDFLKAQYCSLRLTNLKEENDSWPPFQTESYITLAMMYQKNLQTNAETSQTIFLRTKSCISEIPQKLIHQKFTDIAQIFTSSSDSLTNSILIEGHPGIGKTTLVKQVCIKWAEGKLLTCDKLVLLLLLRDPDVQKITNLQQLIEHFIQSPSKVTQLQNYIEDNHGADITLIIDGFDEQSNDLCQESPFLDAHQVSFFHKLIYKKILPKARIVVTSRPAASTFLHKIVHRRIEILGFDQSCRMEYAKEAFKDSPSKLDKLHEHFRCCPSIDAICYIPLLMSIIVFLCICEPDNLPPTASKMYQSFILHIVCHYLRRKKIAEDQPIKNMKHLPPEVQEVIKELQEVAFISLMKDKIVFSIDDLPKICQKDPTCYGLLQSVECYSSKDDDAGSPIKSFNFLHLGIQEYFAAKYVETLPAPEIQILLKSSFLETNTKGIRLSNMWMMYCGLTSGQCSSLRHFLSTYKEKRILWGFFPDWFDDESETSDIPLISRDIMSKKIKVLYLFQCFQEAEDDKLCKILSNSLNSSINLRLSGLLPQHLMCLGLYLSQQNEWVELNLARCHIMDRGIDILHRYLFAYNKNKQKINRIDLRYNSLTGASSYLIKDIITQFQPYTLKLGGNNIASIKDFSTVVVNTNTIKMLEIKNNGLTALEAPAISDIMINSSLEKLFISENKLGNEGAIIVSQGLAKTITLKVLSIWDNEITTKGAIAIADSLACNTSLETLWISNRYIGKEGATAIAQAITKNKTLKKLTLKSYKIFSKRLKRNQTGKTDETLAEESDMILIRSLNHNNTITKLWLPDTLFYNESIQQVLRQINITREKDNVQTLCIDRTDCY